MPTRVLVADDEEFERRAMSRILSRSGIADLEVVEATNGREALEAAEALAAREGGQFAAVFLDIRMPGIDGLEAARLLRERDPSLPIVFLTAHDRFEYARSALRLRIDDFLLKPASAEEVLAALGRALEARASSRAPAPQDDGRLASAEGWLADALRAELAEGRVREEGLARWRAVRGGVGPAICALYLRVEGATGLADRQGAGQDGVPGRHPIAMALERACSEVGLEALAGAQSSSSIGARALCLVFSSEAGSGTAGASGAANTAGTTSTAGDYQALGREAAERALRSLRAMSGIVGFLGCASGVGPAEDGASGVGPASREIPPATDLARAASCAASVAGPEKPVVCVNVAAAASSECEGEGRGERELSSKAATRALALMEERLVEDLTLDGVAEAVGVSPSHLSRLLARQAGMGFSDSLAAIRVERAKTYLAGGAASVKEVASLVGFRDPAYFARVFRRFTGISPAEYRDRDAKGMKS